MIPLTTRLGFFYDEIKNNTSFKKLDIELRKTAKKVRFTIIDGIDCCKYVLKSSFFSGEQEFIVIGHNGDEIQFIGINSKDPREYLQMADIIRNSSPMINLVEDKGNFEYYTDYEEKFIFLIGQNSNNNNVLSISRNNG